MRVPLEWLREFVDFKTTPEETAHILTMMGLEVEAIENVEGDCVFEVNVTPNRPDCLSILGIARELAAACKTSYHIPEHNVLAEMSALDFNVDIADIDLCHRYAGRIIHNVEISPSPQWMRKRLEKCGIRSINNVVDITNYVLLELGHPLHAFDLNELKGDRIIAGTSKKVRGQGAKVKITTLDGIEREVLDDTLLIWDAEKPIAIAGIMGGELSGVTEKTVDIFVESAYFEPASIRRTSKLLGLKTESSYRFERGADIKMLKKALDRAAFLIKEIAGGEIRGKVDLYPKSYKPQEITISCSKINNVLGIKLTTEEITDCLHRLGLEVESSGDVVKIKPPAYRRDIQIDADIIEEVARIYGYDNIPSALPKATVGIDAADAVKKTDSLKKRHEIKESLLKAGFSEAVNYSFIGRHDLDILSLDDNDSRRNMINIMNPLKSEDSCMRTFIMPSLIRNMVYNVSHGAKELRLFETANVFLCRQGSGGERICELPHEKNLCAVLLYKEKIKTLYKEETHDFYLIKGLLESLLSDFRIRDYGFVRSSEPFVHPGQSADIIINGNKIGYAGALSPIVVERLDMKAQKPSIVIAEFDVDALISYAADRPRYMPIPKYPYVERDTAIVVDASLLSSVIMDIISSYKSDLIEECAIFDVYQGKGIPEGKKSIAFNMRYRAADRTLKDDEVETLHNSLVTHIIDKTKGELRQ
jgi:phenylalanyl-tRNA synthetase beta chain